MRLAVIGVLCGCNAAQLPFPPAPTLQDPTLGQARPSQPAGESIIVQAVPPVVGSTETQTHGSSELIQIRLDHGGKHQDTEQRLRSRIKVLEVEGRHARKLEVTIEEAFVTRQVEHEADRTDLLKGVYVVTRAPQLGQVTATRADGSQADAGEASSLALITEDLMFGDPSLDLLIDHPVRVGESVPIDMDLSHELAGEAKTQHTVLTLLRATESSATYEIDSIATAQNVLGDIDFKGRRTLVLDREHGRIVDDDLVTFKTTRRPGDDSDTKVVDSKHVELGR